MAPGFLKRLVDLVKGTAPQSASGVGPNEVPIYLRCGRCGATVLLRLRKTSEIQRNYDPENHPNCEFYVRKVVTDGNSRCPNRMDVTIEFDERYRVVRKVMTSGQGEFLTAEEYAKSQEQASSP
jgi:hypothetical protein